MLRFDNKGTWWPLLDDALIDDVPAAVRKKLAATAPEFFEDARDLLLSWTDRDAVVDTVIAWIRSMTVAGYHGSRLTDAEVESICADGLAPLTSEDRRPRLQRALACHPRWCDVADDLDECLRAYGPGATGGSREGQVHLTLSRQGLVDDFNCYLTHGSEFDQRIAYDLLGDAGVELLRLDGKARVIELAVPGNCALEAIHRHFSLDDFLRRGDLPNLVRELLAAWSYGLAKPELDCGGIHVNCGMVFSSTVPPSWIVDVENQPI